uniref:Large ribosomal subunit protein uL15 n=1 Tax=Paramormyrops kingsleyae TaxID=1676925 RepID=A0A3B3T7V6_9TELE
MKHRNSIIYRNSMFCPTINLDKLWKMVSEQTRVNYGKKPDGPAAVIEVMQAVSEKSCFGNSQSRPVIVKAKFFSRKAEEKITEVGGACELMTWTVLKNKWDIWSIFVQLCLAFMLCVL